MVYERKALYYETDQMAIIHHSNYIRWFEEARIAFLEQMGLSYKGLEARGILIPVLEAACQYKHAVVYDEIVLIEVAVTSFNGIKFSASYRVTGKENGQLKAEGTSKHCFVNRNLQPVSLKKLCPEVHELFVKAVEG